MNSKSSLCTLKLSHESGASAAVEPSATQQRLEAGFIQLRDLLLARKRRGDEHWAQSEEDRIVWRELLELELQDVEEQMENTLAVHAESIKTNEPLGSS